MTLITVLAAGSRDNNEHGRIIDVPRSNTWSLSAVHRTFSAASYLAQIQRADHRFYGSINRPYTTHTHTEAAKPQACLTSSGIKLRSYNDSFLSKWTPPFEQFGCSGQKSFTTEIQNFRMVDTMFVTTSSQQIRSCSLHGFGDNAFLSVCTQQMQYTACSDNPEFL